MIIFRKIIILNKSQDNQNNTKIKIISNIIKQIKIIIVRIAYGKYNFIIKKYQNNQKIKKNNQKINRNNQ
jgi:hypothetical protein